MSGEPAQRVVSLGDFLVAIFGAMTRGHIYRFSIDRADGSRHVDWANVLAVPQAWEERALGLSTSDVWFGMATHAQPLDGNQRGSASDCLAISSLWVDIDIAGPNHAALDLPRSFIDAAKLLASMPVTPTVVVRTGGGLQAFWSLAQAVERERAQAFLARWGATWAALGARRGWHVDNVFDITRVMRMPGTYNRKSEPAQLVTITHFDPSRRYALDEFTPHLIEQPAPAVAASAHLRLVTPLIGNERPGDIYNATTSPAVVLLAHGWVLDHSTSQGDHYRAPHRADQLGSTGATVYANDGHCQIWSETFLRAHGLIKHYPYDAFGLLAQIEHGGDFRAASAAVDTAQNLATRHQFASGASEQAETSDDSGESCFVDWGRFWLNEQTETTWLAEPLLAAGRAHALYAPGGTGKSLLALWLAAQLATGGVGLDGVKLVRRRVMYLDYEMTADDLRERLEAMGFDADSVLEWLFYALLPPLPPADSPEGGKAIVELARQCDAEIVFVDTFARAVSGDENEADTVRAWYRWTGMHLKAEGRAFMRTDHAGKDMTKGQRGTSAKNDDVDVVWSMIVADGGFTLRAVKRRMAWVPEVVAIVQRDEPALSFSTARQPVLAGTIDCADRLEALGAALDITRRAAGELLRDNGGGVKTAVLGAALKLRKEREPRREPRISMPSRTASGANGSSENQPSSDGGNHGGNQREPGSAADVVLSLSLEREPQPVPDDEEDLI